MTRRFTASLRSTLLAATALMLASPAWAEPKTFDVPAQAASEAISALAKQGEVQILLPGRSAAGVRTKAVTGNMSVDAALMAMLSGTGLTAHKIGDQTWTVVPVEISSPRPTRTAAADVTEAPASRSDEKIGSLEEITVTAQKRTEHLKDVPISIVVISGKKLDSDTGDGMRGALERVAGISFSAPGEGNLSPITLRGIGAMSNLLGGSSPVGVYLDTAPFSFIRNAWVPNMSAYDLQQIEVLRGPQGTLYGANAEAGVIRVLTNNADSKQFDFKARVGAETTKGGDPSMLGDFMVNVPVVEDKLAVRAVMSLHDMGGWIDRPLRPNTNSEIDQTYRFKINATPTDNLSIELSYWHERDHWNAPPAGYPDGTAPDTGTQTEAGGSGLDVAGLKINYQFADFSVSSQSSLISLMSQNNQDLDPYAVLYPGLDGRDLYGTLPAHAYSEEFLVNSVEGAPWKWTLGAFYRHDLDRWYQLTNQGTNYLGFKDVSKSYAFFGQLGRRFLDDKFEFSIGLRQFHDQVTDTSNDPTLPNVVKTATYHALTPRATLSWFANKDLTLYATYSQGFRSGTPQYYIINSLAPSLPTTGPDKLYNYEVGAKGDLFDKRVTVDTALYFMRWAGIQQSLTIPYDGGAIPALVDGGTASGLGYEISLTAHPTDWVDIGGTFSWSGLTFDHNVYSGSDLLFATGDRTGNAPAYTGSVFGNLHFPLANDIRGEFSASANYTGAYVGRTYTGTSVETLTGNNMVMASLAFSVIFPSNWTAKLYVDNLTNESGSLTPPTADAPTLQELVGRERPRTFGLQVEYHLH